MSDVSIAEGVGYLAAFLTLGVFYMKTMIPLRIVGILANIAFIAYGALGEVYPVLVLHAILLPLNVTRLWEMVAMVRAVRNASASEVSIDVLKPFMTPRACARGEVLFRKGDVANAMFYIVSGRFRVPEIGRLRGPGDLVGELGLVSPRQERTRSLECIEDGQLLVMGFDEVRQLFFQNPRFGFYFLRLVSQRLFEDVALLEHGGPAVERRGLS
jgi:CRP/FNR family cyclic AMP-dependent transcriptional regulator